ncbi:hypothetical protein TWF694_008458 [Orbilia ellipsospora]|uniref:Uncharacterized protein n=1 Tax=Orbilia ellipsospora TaxID=2528407 RepID=A0AAV9XG78_9PEZI
MLGKALLGLSALGSILGGTQPKPKPKPIELPPYTEILVDANPYITDGEIKARPNGYQTSLFLNPENSCTMFVPWLNAGYGKGKFPDTTAPKIYVSIDDRKRVDPLGVTVDTTSTGLVIGKVAWETRFGKDWDKTDKSTTGWKYHSATSTLYHGYWVSGMNITINNLDKSPILQATVPFFVYESKGVCTSGVNYETGACLGEIKSLGDLKDASLGIGWGNRDPGAAQFVPATNPLVNINIVFSRANPRNTVCRYRNGYVVTKNGLRWGLTQGNTEGMRFIELERNSPLEFDWVSPTACFGVNEKRCKQGDFIMDTTTSNLYFASPDLPASSQEPEEGTDLTSIQLLMPDSGFGMGGYNYTRPAIAVGNVEPNRFELNKTETDKRLLMNTGSHFFNGFELAYDAERGNWGIRHFLPNQVPSP